MSNKQEQDLVGSIWKKEKDGKSYLSAIINGQNMVIFENKKKKKWNSPDYLVFKPKPEREKPANYEQNKKEAVDMLKNNKSKLDVFGDDDIPF